MCGNEIIGQCNGVITDLTPRLKKSCKDEAFFGLLLLPYTISGKNPAFELLAVPARYTTIAFADDYRLDSFP